MEAECVCVYASSNAKADSLSCPIMESRYVFTRFKKAERSFGCCCQNTIDIRIQVFVCKYQCLFMSMSYIELLAIITANEYELCSFVDYHNC